MRRYYSLHFILFYFLICATLCTAQSNKNNFDSNLPLKTDDVLAETITNLIVENIDTIKAMYYKVEGLKNYPFQTASLFVLGDVMMLSHQLDKINFTLFKKSIVNNSFGASAYDSTVLTTKQASFGKYEYCVFGNQTNNINFITIDRTQLETIFNIEVKTTITETKELLLDELICYSKEERYNLPTNLIDGFNELGLMQREIMSIPVLTKYDYTELLNVSAIIENRLIYVLEKNYDKVYEQYYNSSFEQVFSFQEYFNLWCNYLSTNITNRLIDLGYIKIPAPRNFNYIIFANE